MAGASGTSIQLPMTPCGLVSSASPSTTVLFGRSLPSVAFGDPSWQRRRRIIGLNNRSRYHHQQQQQQLMGGGRNRSHWFPVVRSLLQSHSSKSVTNESKVADLNDILSERGACGVGFIANMNNEPSHRIIQDALTALGCMEHRGGCGADNDSGDGSGVMTSVPWDLYNNWADKQGIALLDKCKTGVGMVFLSKDEKHLNESKAVITNIFLQEGLEVIGWRPVPVDKTVVGFSAKESMPIIQQVFVKVVKEENVDDIERELYICRKLIERASRDEQWGDELYFCSLSNQTIVYKGMLRSQVLGQFYIDLQSHLYKSPFAIYHRRYSTNTSPKWPLAQPMRLLGHNGEINTIQVLEFFNSILFSFSSSSVFRHY
ncbi:hypothetical protein ZOSMA_440G00150 [Zostera marina]|uniref:glutamate synthase (ferredoxin) n=1 Tax=Zostera marina TaxID=29655 RepID=A0A0K9P1G4_ZOSMR|nr:hypothetical protein ZOSMA_440G00150 [Zostera marina]